MGAAAIPDEFVCPISGDVMRDPVWLSTGVAVDRVFGEWYLQAGFTKCPVSGDTIKDERLVPVPNMKEYIAKWGRRVGFDLDVAPTEDAKTHAIIQALERVEQTGTSVQTSSLPRATPAEIEEAWAKSGLNQPRSPISPAAVAAEEADIRAREGDFEAAGNATGGGNSVLPANDELSLTLKGYAAANAVPAPDSQDGESPASSQDNQYFPGDDSEAICVDQRNVAGLQGGESTSRGFMGKIFSSSKAARLRSPRVEPVDASPRSLASESPRAWAGPLQAGGTQGEIKPSDLHRYSSGSSSLPSSRRISSDSSLQDQADEGPSQEASRAAAAWTPPLTAHPGAATAVTRSRKSAASYAANSYEDSASFANQLGKASQNRPLDIRNGEPPAMPSGSEPWGPSEPLRRDSPSRFSTQPDNETRPFSDSPPNAAVPSRSHHDHRNSLQPARSISGNPLSVRNTSGVRRNSYAQYGSSSHESGRENDDRPGAHATGEELTPGDTSASGSLMEEVLARTEVRRLAPQLQTPDNRDREQGHSIMPRWDDESKQPQDANLAWLMGRTADHSVSGGVTANKQRDRTMVDDLEDSSSSQRVAGQEPQHTQQPREMPRSLPLAASLRPANSPNKATIGDSRYTGSFGNAAVAGIDVPLPPESGRDASFDDGTRGMLPSDSVRSLSFDDGTRGPLPPGHVSDPAATDGTSDAQRPGVVRDLSFDDGTRGPLPNGGRDLSEGLSYDDGTRGLLPHEGNRDLTKDLSFDDGTRGPLPYGGNRDLSFDDGTRNPPFQDVAEPEQVAPYPQQPYISSRGTEHTPKIVNATVPEPQSTSSSKPTPKPNLTAGGMPVPSKTVGGRVRRLSRRLSGSFSALIGRKPTMEGPATYAEKVPANTGPQQVVARQAVPSDSFKATHGAAAVVGASAVGRTVSSAGSGGGSSYMAAAPQNGQEMANTNNSSDGQAWMGGNNDSRRSLNAPERGSSLASDDLAAAAADVDRQMAGSESTGPMATQWSNSRGVSPASGQPLQSDRRTEDGPNQQQYMLPAGNSEHHRSASMSSTNPQEYGNMAQTDGSSYQGGSQAPGGHGDYEQTDFDQQPSSHFNDHYDEPPQSQVLSPEQQQYQRQQLLQQQAKAAAAATAKEKPLRGLFRRRLGRRNSKTVPSLVSLNSFSQQPQRQEELSSQSPMSRSPSAASHQRMTDQAEVVSIVNKMRVADSRDPRVTNLVPVLERLAQLTDDNDEMRSYFIATGGANRLTQLAESPHAALKAASARVVWHLARNPVVAMELMRMGVVPALYTVFKVSPQDPLPFIGALVHFNCHNQELAPFTADQIRGFIDALLIAGSSAEDALAASFCLLRIYEASKPPSGGVLKLLAEAGGAVQALVAMLGLPFCSGSEAAARLLGALSQNISAMAARIAHHGGVQGLAQLLDCPVPSGRTAAAQALAKVVAAAPAARALVSMDDVTAPLFDMLRSGDSSAAEAAAWLVGYCATDSMSRRHLTSCGVASALMPALAGEVGGGAREGASWAADQIAHEAGGVEPFAAAGACPALLGLVKTGQHLGRDSALRLLAAIGRSDETDGVTLVGTAGLKAVLPLLTTKPDQNNRASRVAAMEVVRVMCTQHGVPRKTNIELAVREGAVKAVVAIARSGAMPGRDAAAASLAELSASGSKAAMQVLRKDKAVAALIPIMIGGSVGGREASAVALANLAAGSKDTASEIVKAHGLVGLNQLLLSGTPSGKAAGAALVARLAPSPSFQKADTRGPLLTSLAAAVGLPAAATRVAAAEALLAMGGSNASNKQVVTRAVPALLQMLRTSDLAQVEAAAMALSTMTKSPHMLATERIEAGETASTLRAAGVVGPPAVAALDSIISACRSAAPGRPSRGASYADYGATGAAGGYTTAARRTSYADYGSGGGGPPASSNGYSNSPFSTSGIDHADSRGRLTRGSSGLGSGAAEASSGAPPWAQAATYDSPKVQQTDYEYSPSPASQSGYSATAQQQQGGGWRQR